MGTTQARAWGRQWEKILLISRRIPGSLNLHQVLHGARRRLEVWVFLQYGYGFHPERFPMTVKAWRELVGKEEFIGLPLVAGFKTARSKALVAFFAKCPILERRLQQYSKISAVQIAQIAACNRLHEVDERLWWWLLMCADRVGSNQLPLTQEFLAPCLAAAVRA